MIPKLSIIVPCCNEEAILENSISELSRIMDDMVSKNKISDKSEIVCVDDGSSDTTWTKIRDISYINNRIQGIKLSRNVGHQNALLAGLSQALDNSSDLILTIDADLQDDILIIETMIDSLNNNGCDIIYGVRNNRDIDSIFKKSSASLFYNLMRNSHTNVIPHHADFRLMSRRAVSCLMEFKERNLFLRGIVPLVGFRSEIVEYERKPRLGGKSKYPFIKMLSFAIEGITSFSVRPIRLIFLVGLIFLIITLSVLIYVVISIILGRNIPGWASIMLSLWFIGSLVLMSLGVIGEYVSKIYIEVKDRPRFFVEERTDEMK